MHVDEPAVDLGVLMAIASSFCNRSFDASTVVIGEVGLGGEVRGVLRIESRIKEAIQMGFKRCIIPKRNLKGLNNHDNSTKIHIQSVEWVDDAIHELLH
jgi:DNA repair protein RadA/Sms